MNTPADRWLRVMVITLGGSGYARIASGTWGSLVALAVFAAVWLPFSQFQTRPDLEALLLVAGVLTSAVLSVVWGEWAIAHFNSRDPKPFVLDEFAGQWVALLWLPPAAREGLWGLACVLAGQFLLFRILDVIKPPPARQLERLPGGWGILLDDVMAGAYACLLGQIVWRLTPLAAALGITGDF